MAALPAGWTEHADGSGKVFYYKAATGETSWDRPAAAVAAAAASGGLPEGWTEHMDPGSGRAFYCKAATGETSWEKPSNPAAASGAASGGLPEGWAEHQDPGSGKTFYYKAATGETSWEKPGGGAGGADSAGGGSDLADGWTAQVDPGSQRTFYYKAATGETTWDKPKKTTGTWSAEQAWNLGKQPKPGLQGKVQILDKTMWSSVMRTVDALNSGGLAVDAGLCVLYSTSKDSYWLLWRSDKGSEAESLNENYGS